MTLGNRDSPHIRKAPRINLAVHSGGKRLKGNSLGGIGEEIERKMDEEPPGNRAAVEAALRVGEGNLRRRELLAGLRKPEIATRKSYAGQFRELEGCGRRQPV
jgi:hypothetical protein